MTRFEAIEPDGHDRIQAEDRGKSSSALSFTLKRGTNDRIGCKRKD